MRIAAWCLLATVLFAAPCAAQDQSAASDQGTTQPAQPAKRTGFAGSPWLIVPIASSNPKLGTAFGALGAYLHTFDEKSRVSIFGATFQYTTTDSKIGGLVARTSSGADHHRVVALAVFGLIKNDYEDYLGTGQPLKTNDDMTAVAGRYVYRVPRNWFVGAQASAANYQVLGETAMDDQVLDVLGVTGFKSAGIGAVLMHDSRDNEDMPTGGWFLNVNNIAYREGLGGDDSFDAYRVDARAFWTHRGGHVLAVRENNRFSVGAPAAAESTVILRGYKQGQYLGRHMSSIEGEERFRFTDRLGATLFGGVAWLYGEGVSDLSDGSAFGSWGFGMHYVLKPVERMLVNLEYAHGKADNWGLYLKLGYAW